MEDKRRKGFYIGGSRAPLSDAVNITYENKDTLPFTDIHNVQDAIDNIYNLIEGNSFKFDTNTSTDYIKENPEGTQKKAKVVMVDGRSFVLNQLNNNALGGGTNNGITFTKNNDGTWTLNGTATANASWGIQTIYPLPNHKYAYVSNNDNLNIGFGAGNTSKLPVGFGEKGILAAGASADGTATNLIIRVQNDTTLENKVIKVVLVDLSVWFGLGNEPTIDEFVAIAPNILNTDYNTGEIINAPLQKIVSKDSSDVVIDNYVILDDVKDLPLYGASAGTVANTLDIAGREYIQRVGSVDLGGLNYYKETNDFGSSGLQSVIAIPTGTLANIICAKYEIKSNADVYSGVRGIAVSSTGTLRIADSEYSTPEELKTALNGVILYFELATPVVADLSDIITEDYIEVADDGTLEFVNNEDYNIPVQNTEIYMTKI